MNLDEFKVYPYADKVRNTDGPAMYFAATIDLFIKELEAKIKMLEGALNMSNIYPKDNV